MRPSYHKFICIFTSFMFLTLFVSGCGDIPQGGIQSSGKGIEFYNEQQLVSSGLLQQLNQEVDLGDDKVLLQKVIFDADSMTFVYKGRALPEGLFKIGASIKRQPHNNIFKHIEPNPISPGGTIFNGTEYHMYNVPHDLELINQEVPIEILVNGKENRFILKFPGEKLAQTVAEVMVDAEGNEVKSPDEAAMRVFVGVNFTYVESKGYRDVLILDTSEKRLLDRSHSSYTSGESSEFFGPLPLPRKDVKIRVLPRERTIVLTYENGV